MVDHHVRRRTPEFVERQLIEGVNRENGGLALGLAFNAIRDVGWMEMAAMARAVLAERVKRQLEFAGTEERLIPRLETIELDPDDSYSGA